MAEAALKYDEFDDFDDIEPIEIPAGGIATFLTAKEGMFADDDDDIPTGGIASVKQVADQLAEYGRHEDEFMVHAAEGETVIPMEVFRKNPILKENIYRQMRDMGLEPERYVIGNELNSINPVTGQPEFFIKKLFKKLGKFLKKAIKVILPIALNFIPGVGPILAAALGSGIGGLIQGESFGQALKSAAIGGLTAGVVKGVAGGVGAVKEGGKFASGFKAGVMAPADVSAFAAGKASPGTFSSELAADTLTKAADVQTALGEKIAGEVRPLDKIPVDAGGAPPAAAGTQADYSALTKKASADAIQSSTAPVDYSAAMKKASAEAVQDPTQMVTPETVISDVSGQQAPPITAKTAQQFIEDSTVKLPDLGESFKKLGPGGDDFMEGARELFMPKSALRNQATGFVEQAIKSGELTGIEIGTKAFDNVVSKIMDNPTLMRRFGPAAITTMGIGNLISPGQNPESIDINSMGINEAMALLEANPEKYDPFGGAQLTPRGAGGFNAYEIQSTYNQPLGTQTFQSQPTGNVASDVFATVANGGGMNVNDFPPRVGAIAGPGTETSDDIPAMLSDGEFVMTAEAVRGAGNGNRQNGMRNMYQMMNQFEAMA